MNHLDRRWQQRAHVWLLLQLPSQLLNFSCLLRPLARPLLIVSFKLCLHLSTLSQPIRAFLLKRIHLLLQHGSCLLGLLDWPAVGSEVGGGGWCGYVDPYVTDMLFLKKLEDYTYLHLSVLVWVLQLQGLVLFMDLLWGKQQILDLPAHSWIKDCPIYRDMDYVAPCHQGALILVVDTCWSAAASLCWKLLWIIFSRCSKSAELWSPACFAEGLISACKHGYNHTKTQWAYWAFSSKWVWVVGCSCEFAVCTCSGTLLKRFSDVS